MTLVSNPLPDEPFALIAQKATLHALIWLNIGNFLGLLLATLLLWPNLNNWLPFTYGRITSAHMEIQLYGWSAIPLVALLLHGYASPNPRWSRMAHWSLRFWSFSLTFAALDWLTGGFAGHTHGLGGKLFMDWSGTALLLFCLNLLALWWVLANGDIGKRSWPWPKRKCHRHDANPLHSWIRVALLALLAFVPTSFFWAARADLYPAINPDSGGATGSSLFASSLGFIALVLLLPLLLKLKAQPQCDLKAKRAPKWYGFTFFFHSLILFLMGFGDRSNREWPQILGLGSLILWLPLLVSYLRGFEWLQESKRWLKSLLIWGALLVGQGWLMFLPNLLNPAKFTQIPVAHAHLALAAFVSSFLILILQQLGNKRDPFSGTFSFYCWQFGIAFHLLALLALGTLEIQHPSWLFRTASPVRELYFLRLLSGGLMSAASFFWLARALGWKSRLAREVQRLPRFDASQPIETKVGKRYEARPLV